MTAGPETGAPARPAMRGDLTQGPILRTLFIFSIPLLASNVLQTVNGSVNAIWVGRLLGEKALAATTNANGVVFMLMAGVFGLGMATMVRVGQHFGARNLMAARRTFGAGMGFCLAYACLFGVVGWFFTPRLLELLATPEGSVDMALTYLRVTFVTMPLGALAMLLTTGMRAVGEARLPFFATLLVVVLDIVLNPLLILGIGPVPALGIAGSALSTALANLAGLLLQIFIVYRKDLVIRLRGAEFGWLMPSSKEARFILTKGVPMFIQGVLFSSAQLTMIGLVNREGIDTTAAFGAMSQLWNYLQMPALAIGAAVSAMAAQNIGAGNHGRVDQVTRAGMIANVTMTGTMAILLMIFSYPLIALFLGHTSPAVPIAHHMQLIVTWTFVLMGASMILSGTMRAYGVVVIPLLLQVIVLYPIRLGFYFVAYPYLGADALWWAFPVASLCAMLLWGTYYLKGRWRRVRDQNYAR